MHTFVGPDETPAITTNAHDCEPTLGAARAYCSLNLAATVARRDFPLGTACSMEWHIGGLAAPKHRPSW